MRAFDASFVRPIIVIAVVVIAATCQAADGRFDQTLQVSSTLKSGALKLDIATDAGEILLRAGGPGKIEIHAKLHSIDDSQDDNVATRIRMIELNPPVISDAHAHSVRIGHFADPDLAANIAISYEIVAPQGTELHSETGVGNQSVEGIQGPVEASSGTGKVRVWHIGKNVHISTGSGDIDIHDIHGSVQAEAGMGSVYASEIESPQAPAQVSSQVQIQDSKTGQPVTVQLMLGVVGLEVVTGAGDVDVENLQGQLHVTSGSGNIHATGNPTSDWKLQTGTGAVRVQFSDDANLAIIAHASSGTIESADAVVTQAKRSPHELRGQIGKGGPTVDLKTASGNIEIK
jgi:hypothetical protein